MVTTIPWATLTRFVRDIQGGAEPPITARAILGLYRATGRTPRHGWLRVGLDHEVTGQPWTFGPRAPADVDWTGF